MGQIANLILKDGASTSVDVTFSPQMPQVGETPAQWLNKDALSPIGYRKVTVFVKAQVSGMSKVTIKIEDPKLSTVDAIPTVGYFTSFIGTFNLPATSRMQDRKDILAFAKNLLGHAVLASAVVDLEPVY